MQEVQEAIVGSVSMSYGQRLALNREALNKKETEKALAAARNLALTPYVRGVKRREAILFYLENSQRHSLAVNRHYQLQTQYDSDLNHLLKKGKIKLVREGSKRCRQTYVVLA